MTNLSDLRDITEAELLVAFSDLHGFKGFARSITDRDLFDRMAAYYEWVGDQVATTRGRVVKFMGDAALIVFPGEDLDSGITALLALKREGDRWLESRGISCVHRIKAHLGPVVCGAMGTRVEKHFDVIGETVSTAAMLESGGLSVTARVIEGLKPEIRALFEARTPSVTYFLTETRP
jgi:adenylate cyclase